MKVQAQQLYESSATEQEVLDYMRAAGYRLAKSDAQSAGREKNLHFTKNEKE